MCHKNGSRRILESTASTIRNDKEEVEKLVIVNRDITDRKHAEEQLAHNALHDAMTGLPNRRLFLDRLQRCFAEAQRDFTFHYAVVLLDLDRFKIFNDTMGTVAGDQMIVEIARRLEGRCHTSDPVSLPIGGKTPTGEIVLARLGGDEFGILLERANEPSDAMRLANQVQIELNAPLTLQGRKAFITASIGIALNSSPQGKADDLLRDAEDAMRRAKAMGGSRSELFDTALHTRAINRLKLETDLRTALDQNQFKIHYQPIHLMETRRVVSFEALVRWQHPEQGLISPYKFMEASVDTFKIDRSLINNLLADRVSHDAVDLILTLATKLNKKWSRRVSKRLPRSTG